MITHRTEDFYDDYWPRSVPNYEQTKQYMLETLSKGSYRRALDAGCGHGLCAVVLSELASEVLAVDISPKCVETAQKQAEAFTRNNITVAVQDLQQLNAPSDHFDLVWCWGVAMMAPDPQKVIDHLLRVTRPGGEVYLGVYLKTWLSPVHEVVRKFCRVFMATPRKKRWVLDGFAWLTRTLVKLRGEEINRRPDNVSIQVQVEDWFYPPFKRFYSIDEILRIFRARGFEATCIQDRLGRFRSATIFVVRGVKL